MIKPVIKAESAAIEVNPIKVVMVEDDAGIRDILVEVLTRQPDLQFLASYGSAEAALEGVPSQVPDVVLMDINLPGMSGVECMGRLKARMPRIQFIMLTVYEDSERLFHALSVGASGYLVKRTPPSQIVAAIREVQAGGSPMTPQIARRVVQHFRRTPEPSPEMERLSPREREILAQLAKGYQYKEIADHMGISIDTVRTYVRGVYNKLHVSCRAEAMLKCFGEGVRNPGAKQP